MNEPIDVNKNPERCSAGERARAHYNWIMREFGRGDGLTDERATREMDPLFGVGIFASLSGSAFLEGVMAATAFCSGSISGGKFEAMSKNYCKYDPIDIPGLTLFMDWAMKQQTLWEKNPERLSEKEENLGI